MIHEVVRFKDIIFEEGQWDLKVHPSNNPKWLHYEARSDGAGIEILPVGVGGERALDPGADRETRRYSAGADIYMDGDVVHLSPSLP